MAQPWLVRSLPEVVLAAGLLNSEPVFWLGLEPSGERSGLGEAVDGVEGLSPEPSDEKLGGLVLARPEPGKAVPDEPPPAGAVSRPALDAPEPCPESPVSLPLEEPEPFDPARPESLVLELPVPEPASPASFVLEPAPLEPAKPVSLPLEFPAPEPARLVSLPLELPVPEVTRPLPPALELGVTEFEVGCLRSALLEPEPFVVGRESLPAVLPGRAEAVLSPPPAAVLVGLPD